PDYFSSGNQGWYDSTLAVSPTDPNVVFAGGACLETHLIESTDGGATWANLTGRARNYGPHCDHQAAGFDANGKFLDANDGGLWRLDDPDPANPRWTSLNSNLQITQFVGI